MSRRAAADLDGGGELYPKHSIITVDVADFRVYRRNKREVIPLIHPPR